MNYVFSLLTVLLPLVALPADEPPKATTVRPDKDDTLLVNPGKGYVQYYGTDDKYTKDYIGVVYTRWAWSALEPREGEYHWELIDRFIASGRFHNKSEVIRAGLRLLEEHEAKAPAAGREELSRIIQDAMEDSRPLIPAETLLRRRRRR